MRIISKDKDYYDGMAEHNKKDRLVKVWVRKNKIIPIHKHSLENLDYQKVHFGFGWSHRFEQGMLIISGKVYPFVRHKKTDLANIDEPDKFFYDVESLLKVHPSISKRDYAKRDINDFFKPFSDMTKLCLKLKSPIVLIEPDSQYSRHKDYNTFNVQINPSLSSMDFGKVLSAFEVYQELDYFISNVLVNDEMPTPKQTDKDKILAHGFDLKESFRKRKTK